MERFMSLSSTPFAEEPPEAGLEEETLCAEANAVLKATRSKTRIHMENLEEKDC
jgi:hypothetical protein